MYKLNFLKKENDLNKLIKKQKRDRGRVTILFTSLWDKPSQDLVKKLNEKYGATEDGEQLYVVDSFHMPHSFVIYNTTKLPHLVKLKRDRMESEDYLSNVMRHLKVT
tara:strand:+ start:1789 stop:2109 length:321 start_codon:yes stop_codon:yes gene_type:complete